MPERFVDIHTHILPKMDDGAKDLEQAVELLHLAWNSGTGTVVLTPHYRGRYRRNTPQQLQGAFQQLKQRMTGELPELELYLGNEVAIELELAEKLLDGRALSINGGNYVLLEFRTAGSAQQVVDGVLDVLNCGFTPVIAHAERYDAFCQNRKLAAEVIDLGALIQINGDSILGGAGFASKRCAKRLLRKHQAHFVASDAHDALRRHPMLDKCYEKVSKKYGKEYAAQVFWENARQLLEESR